MQKLRLVLRGWSRRREEAGKRKQEEFLRRNMSWGAAPAPAAPEPKSPPAAVPRLAQLPPIDMEGLQAAYLDASGRIAYYLDIESGEVVESRDSAPMDPARYKPVPARGQRSEIDERRAFIETLEPSSTKQMLMKSVGSPAFRTVLASDRALERAWYNFRNSSATAAVEEWLRKSGFRSGRG